jgi:hypothetical protein
VNSSRTDRSNSVIVKDGAKKLGKDSPKDGSIISEEPQFTFRSHKSVDNILSKKYPNLLIVKSKVE